MKTSILICVSLVVLMFVATGCYEVEYTVEHKGDNCIKFEDAMYDQDPDEVEEDWVDACLGDDEVEQADMFDVVVDGPVDVILVSLKAGKDKATDVPVPVMTPPIDEDDAVPVGSFLVLVAEIPEDPDDPEVFTYRIIVGCDDIPGGKDGTKALSHITFCFGDATVLSPEEGPITILRHTELEEPGEPEEEDED